MESIFGYLDYRTFLKDFIEKRKQELANFSYRNLSQKIGIKSSGYLSMVIKGERNLSEQIARDLCDALNLEPREKKFFITLVRFNHSSQSSEKSELFEEIRTMQSGPMRHLSSDEQEFYHKWYFAATRELVSVFPITKNYKAAGMVLRPAISTAEMEDSLSTLERLNVIQWNGEQYVRVDKVLTSNAKIEPFALHQFQRDTLALAGESLDRFPRDLRELSTITMSVDASTYESIRQKIADLRSEIVEMARAVEHPNRIYQCNIQIFPLSLEKQKGLK